MHHIAIMKKELGFLEKIISGQKTIESRWLGRRSAPWKKVHAGDVIYFKNTGEMVSCRAVCRKVEYIELTGKHDCTQIVSEYGSQLGIGNADDFLKTITHKKYAALIYLEHVEVLSQPFNISKKGFGLQSSWMCVGDIQSVII
jgi:ASC-1-like (ASCH) protein